MLVDTDVFVDHLRGARRLRLETESVAYSVVTRSELFAGREGDEGLVRALLAPFVELIVSRGVAERAGRMRRETGLRLPDALIAATALEHKLTLVTRNLRDFVQVEGLQVRRSD